MDLAIRFAGAVESRGLRVLALKGISVADELYGGVWNRPMADVDLLVTEARRFEEVVHVATAMGLVETGASDHALAFKEGSTGAVVELHISLTSCPGLFRVDTDALWERRKAMSGSPLFRLADEDLVVHLALHLAFQHGFAANHYHYADFVHALKGLALSTERLIARAHEWRAASSLGAVAEALQRHTLLASDLPEQVERLRPLCPTPLARWITSQREFPPQASLGGLAVVRCLLAPSKWSFLAGTLVPRAIPGRTQPRTPPLQRFWTLARNGIGADLRLGSTRP